MQISLCPHRSCLPPQGEGDREAVVGVCLQWKDTPPVSFADSPL